MLTFVVKMASSSSASQDAANEAVKVPYVASSILERIWVDRSRTVAFRGGWDGTVDVIVVVGEILFLASLLLLTTRRLVCRTWYQPASSLRASPSSGPQRGILLSVPRHTRMTRLAT